MTLIAETGYSRALGVAAAAASERTPPYLKFFRLSGSPFLTTPDPRFLFLTREHREALTGLITSIVQRRGICVLTGDAGTGKTTILRMILEAVPESVARFGLIVHPTVGPSDFLELLLLDLGSEQPPAAKARQLFDLQQILLRLNLEGKLVVLIVDEAHKLSSELIEEIRLLANFECAAGKLLQIILSGQDELEALLEDDGLRQFKQRIACRAALHPLAPEMVPEYIAYRWAQAGGAGQAFGEDSLDYVAFFSGGIPRVINGICDYALALACSDRSGTVAPQHVIGAVKALRWIPERLPSTGAGERAGRSARPARSIRAIGGELP